MPQYLQREVEVTYAGVRLVVRGTHVPADDSGPEEFWIEDIRAEGNLAPMLGTADDSAIAGAVLGVLGEGR